MIKFITMMVWFQNPANALIQSFVQLHQLPIPFAHPRQRSHFGKTTHIRSFVHLPQAPIPFVPPQLPVPCRWPVPPRLSSHLGKKRKLDHSLRLPLAKISLLCLSTEKGLKLNIKSPRPLITKTLCKLSSCVRLPNMKLSYQLKIHSRIQHSA